MTRQGETAGFTLERSECKMMVATSILPLFLRVFELNWEERSAWLREVK